MHLNTRGKVIHDHSKILVTGGAGFIGSHLVKRLVRLGYDVRILDDMSTGREDNLRGLMDRVELIKDNLDSLHTVRRAVAGVDGVVHLAAKVDVEESLKQPFLYHKVNSTGTLKLLEAAKKHVKKFVYISTCAVYGDPVRLPVDESHPVSPLSPYAASKLCGENYCVAYSGSYGLQATILRLFNVYGPRPSADRNVGAIVGFMRRIRKDEAPVIFGDGEQTRDFIFVDDVADLIPSVLKSDAIGVFNVGMGTSISINTLADILLRTMGKESLKPVRVDQRFGEIRHSRADVSKAKEAFAFNPKVGLEEGVRRSNDAA